MQAGGQTNTMYNIRHKDIYYDHNENLKRRKKIFCTILLAFFFLVFEYITIFNGTRFIPYSGLAMLAAWSIAIVITLMWIDHQKMVNATDYLSKLKHLLIGSFKLLLVITPIIYLTLESINYVQDYQLKKYGIIAKGEITNVTVNTNTNDPIYHADFTFLVKDQVKSGFSVINKNEYEISDSVIILYSSDDINLHRLKGKINLTK